MKWWWQIHSPNQSTTHRKHANFTSLRRHTRAGKEIYAHKRTYTYSHIYEGGGMRENIYIFIRWFITNRGPDLVNKLILFYSIYDPDSSLSLSYIWSWFFPVMHCLIYDPDSSPSCTVVYMILILPRHALSYILSLFFPRHCPYIR
jgi:hypothetical protein